MSTLLTARARVYIEEFFKKDKRTVKEFFAMQEVAQEELVYIGKGICKIVYGIDLDIVLKMPCCSRHDADESELSYSPEIFKNESGSFCHSAAEYINQLNTENEWRNRNPDWFPKIIAETEIVNEDGASVEYRGWHEDVQDFPLMVYLVEYTTSLNMALDADSYFYWINEEEAIKDIERIKPSNIRTAVEMIQNHFYDDLNSPTNLGITKDNRIVIIDGGYYNRRKD